MPYALTDILSDTFSGAAGSVVGHAPELGDPGWLDSFGDKLGLSGDGALCVQNSPAPDDSGTIYYPLDHAEAIGARIAFTFTTTAPTGTDPSDGYTGRVTAGALIGGMPFRVSLERYREGSATYWRLNLYGYPEYLLDLALDTTYSAVLDIADGVQTFAMGDFTQEMVHTFSAPSAGAQEVTLQIGGSFRMLDFDLALTLPEVGHLTADLTGPAGTLRAFLGMGARLVAPAGRLRAGLGLGARLTGKAGTLYATAHDSTGENAASITAPKGLLLAYGGSAGRARAPMAQLSIAATGVNWLNAELTAPAGTLSASGTVSGTAQGELTTPMATLVGYGGMVCSVTLGGRPTLQASVTAGGIMRAAIAAPSARLTMFGVTTEAFSRAEIIAPAGKMGGTLQAWVIAPAGRLSAIGTAVVAATYEAYSINLTHKPRAQGQEPAVDEVTRYTNFPFDQIVRFRGDYYGVAADGLYKLGGATDDGEPIAYAVKTCIDDFKAPELKNVSAAVFGGRLGPAATVTLFAGEDGQESYEYETPRGQAAQNHREKFGRGVKSRYFAIGLAGDDALELDALDPDINKLTRRI